MWIGGDKTHAEYRSEVVCYLQQIPSSVMIPVM